ncbi:ABC transporter permease [Phytomonospora sp. NPDC050363]|uniref:ABC transporter permease n=1 Tax=Phytomonospora sp. NPDC050363 TaxID=3155642 RepID=UPI00340A45ED
MTERLVGQDLVIRDLVGRDLVTERLETEDLGTEDLARRSRAAEPSAAEPSAAEPSAARRGPEPRARFGDLLAAEWIKLRSLRSVSWSVVLGGLLVIAMNVGSALSDHLNWADYGEPVRADFFPDWSITAAFTQAAAMVTLLVVGSIAAVLVSSEYQTGMIRTTFAAVPARRAVMAAKLAVAFGLFAGWGAVVGAVSFFGSQAILSLRDVGVPIGHPGALRVVVASALLAPVAALVATGLAALLRHTAAAIVSVVGLLLLLPALLNSPREWVIRIDNVFPLTAWQRLTELAGGHEPPALSLGGAWAVYAVWVVVAAGLALVVVRRDP